MDSSLALFRSKTHPQRTNAGFSSDGIGVDVVISSAEHYNLLKINTILFRIYMVYDSVVCDPLKIVSSSERISQSQCSIPDQTLFRSSNI